MFEQQLTRYQALLQTVGPASAEGRAYDYLIYIIETNTVNDVPGVIHQALETNIWLRDTAISASDREQWQTRVTIFQEFLAGLT